MMVCVKGCISVACTITIAVIERIPQSSCALPTFWAYTTSSWGYPIWNFINNFHYKSSFHLFLIPYTSHISINYLRIAHLRFYIQYPYTTQGIFRQFSELPPQYPNSAWVCNQNFSSKFLYSIFGKVFVHKWQQYNSQNAINRHDKRYLSNNNRSYLKNDRYFCILYNIHKYAWHDIKKCFKNRYSTPYKRHHTI